MPEFKVENFTGGITDNYIDGQPNEAKKMDNLLVNSYGKAVQRPGLEIYNSDAPQIPPGNQAIDSLYYFDSTLFVKSGTKLYYIEDDDTSWTTLAGPSNDAFADSQLGAKCSWSVWKGHVFITPGPTSSKKGGSRTVKVYRNSSGAWTLAQAGVPKFSEGTADPDTIGAVGASLSAGGTAYTYLYYSLFYVSYTAKVNGVNATFIDFGEPSVTTLTQQPEYTTAPDNDFQGQNFSNGTNENYDTANMAVMVFRTKANGTTPYKVSSFSLGEQIVDDVTDLNLGEAIYAGASEGNFNSKPPLAYFTAVSDGYGWYAGGTDVTDSTLPLHVNRIWQSKVGDIDSVPGDNFVDIEGEKVTALGFAGQNPVVFCRNRTYRLEGRIDSTGGGFVRAVLVSATEGAITQDLGRTSDGIYFMSENGFCYTNGFQVVNLTKNHLSSTYKALSNKANGSTAYDSGNKLAYFGVESSLGSASGNNNSLFVLDETWSQGERGTFTTASAGANLQPVSLHYDSVNDRLLIGDKRGYVFYLNPDQTSDPVVDTSTSYSSWYRTAVIYDYISVATSFGETVLTKWVTRFFAVFKNLTGALSLDLWSINDDKTSTKQMKVVRERAATSEGVHRIKRRFPKNSLRCTYKQVQMKKGLVVIARSDDYALATTSVAGKTVLLASGTWPNDGSDSLVGHSIYFESDSYTQGYQITIHSGDTLTLATAPPAVTGGKWVVKGYPKAESVEIHSLSIPSDVIGNTFTAYAQGGDGSNG